MIGIVVHPENSSLALISQVAPALATGNTCAVIAPYKNPVSAITFAEIAATSDVPAGVLNILTGDYREIGTWISEHLDVDGIDLTGVLEPDLATTYAQAASVNVKRVLTSKNIDFQLPHNPYRLTYWTETKTVWHPIGS